MITTIKLFRKKKVRYQANMDHKYDVQLTNFPKPLNIEIISLLILLF